MTTVFIKKFIKSGSGDDPSCYRMVECKGGDGVCFKSDYEQCGRIAKITPRKNYYGGQSSYELTAGQRERIRRRLYLRYATSTVVCADDCWL